MELPQGLMSLLALFVGGHVGMKVAEWASRLGPQAEPISRAQLAAVSVWRARAALFFPWLAAVFWFVGGALTIRLFFSLLPGRIVVALLFVFISMSCLLGLARGAYEALLALGPAVDERAPWSLGGLEFFDATPGLRMRGTLRLLICSSVIALMAVASLFLGPG